MSDRAGPPKTAPKKAAPLKTGSKTPIRQTSMDKKTAATPKSPAASGSPAKKFTVTKPSSLKASGADGTSKSKKNTVTKRNSKSEKEEEMANVDTEEINESETNNNGTVEETVVHRLENTAISPPHPVEHVISDFGANMYSTQRSSDAPAELSDFLRRKYTQAFNILYDTTRDKLVSRADFLNLLKKVAKIRGCSPIDPSFKIFQERIVSMWAGLMKGSHRYKGQNSSMHDVSMSEWMTHWGDFVAAANAGGGWPDTSLDKLVDYRWQKDFRDFMFDVMDTNGDGVIDKDEFMKCFMDFDCGEMSCSTSFDKMIHSRPDANVIDKAWFDELWFQFLTSDKYNDPGNYLIPGSVI